MRIEDRIVLGCDPIPDISPDKEERKKEPHHPRQQGRQILHLPSDDNTPSRIGGVMNEDPKIAANQDGEKVKERKQPGERELFARRAPGWRDETDNQRN